MTRQFRDDRGTDLRLNQTQSLDRLPALVRVTLQLLEDVSEQAERAGKFGPVAFPGTGA
jgi:hypothetical protein